MITIFNTLILNNLVKRVEMINAHILQNIHPALGELADIIDQDDERINDLQDKVNKLEKRISELENIEQ